MVKLIPLIFLLMSFSGFAESSKTVLYQGQQFESAELANKKVETRYRTEEVDDTCTRQVPYTVNECNYETRYRTQCRTVPGYQDCRTEYERVCRNVTRYRRQCTSRPGGQDCRTRPGRRQCRTLPNGQQRCRQLPPHRVCRDKPPVRTCRDVPYTERECRREPRRRCDWIPSRRVCEQVPYQERVCRDVTRYRTEEYACRRTIQVPYEVVTKLFEGKVDIQFKESTSTPAKAELNINLDGNGEVSVRARDLSETPTLVLAKRKVDTEDRGDTLDIRALYRLNFIDMNRVLAPVLKPIRYFYLDQSHLAFVMGNVLKPEGIKVTVTIKKRGDVVFTKVLANNEFRLTNTDAGTKLDLALEQFNTRLDRVEHEVTAKVEMLFNDMIINDPAPRLINEKTITLKPFRD